MDKVRFQTRIINNSMPRNDRLEKRLTWVKNVAFIYIFENIVVSENICLVELLGTWPI